MIRPTKGLQRMADQGWDGEGARGGYGGAKALPVLLRNGRTIKAVPPDDILFVRSDGNYAEFHLADGYLLTRASLTDLEERLDERFVRIHRSVIVNMRRLDAIRRVSNKKYEAVLDDARSLPIGSTFYDDLVGRAI